MRVRAGLAWIVIGGLSAGVAGSAGAAARPHGQAGLRGQGGYASVYSVSRKYPRTASGQRLDPRALTAAHRTLPFGTAVRVLNRRNGRSIVVTINDRGPFVRGRVIDLTPAGARSLGFSGLAPVSLTVTQRE